MARALNTSHPLHANLVSLVGVEDDGVTVKDFKVPSRACTMTGGSIGTGTYGLHIATSNSSNNALGVELNPHVPFATTAAGGMQQATIVMVFNNISANRGGSLRVMLGARAGFGAAGNYPWIGAPDTGEITAGRGTNATALLSTAAGTSHIDQGARMVTVSRDGQNESVMYLNGSQVATYTGYGSDGDGNGYSCIGGYAEGSRGYRQSHVVWVAAFNKILTPTEVADLYASLGSNNTFALVEAGGSSVTPVSFSGSVANQNAFEGSSFSLALASYFSGSQIPFAYSVQAGTLPAGLTLGSNGTISGTPTTAGTYSGITVRATDTDTNTADTNAFTITVQAASSNNPPTFTGPNIDNLTAVNGQSMTSVDVSPLFSDTDALTFSAVGSWPPGISVSPAGVIGGTPSALGTYLSLRVRATDTASQTADSNLFSITVDAAPTDPDGTITTQPLKNNTGTVIANQSGVIVHVYQPVTGNKVVTISGLQTNASGVLVVKHTLLDPSTEYRIVVVLPDGGEGMARYTST